MGPNGSRTTYDEEGARKVWEAGNAAFLEAVAFAPGCPSRILYQPGKREAADEDHAVNPRASGRERIAAHQRKT